MPREIVRLPCSVADIVLLEYPQDRYKIDVYWREGAYYERLAEADTIEIAQEILRAAVNALANIHLSPSCPPRI
jgi:hypothetical protein